MPKAREEGAFRGDRISILKRVKWFSPSSIWVIFIVSAVEIVFRLCSGLCRYRQTKMGHRSGGNLKGLYRVVYTQSNNDNSVSQAQSVEPIEWWQDDKENHWPGDTVFYFISHFGNVFIPPPSSSPTSKISCQKQDLSHCMISERMWMLFLLNSGKFKLLYSQCLSAVFWCKKNRIA